MFVPSMTARHFEFLAAAAAELDLSEAQLSHLSQRLATTNPAFKPALWRLRVEELRRARAPASKET